MRTQQMKYEKKIIKTGTSHALIIPADVMKYLNFEEGTEIILQPEEGKHGKFLAIWRK